MFSRLATVVIDAGRARTFSGVSSSGGSLTIWPVILYIDCTICSISAYVMKPSPSMSYSWKAPAKRGRVASVTLPGSPIWHTHI